MNRLVVIAALAASGLLASQGAAAQSSRFYVSGAIGRSQADVDCSGWSSCTKDATAWHGTFGVNVNPGLAVELSYWDLGKAKFSSTGVGSEAHGTFVGLGVMGHTQIAGPFGALIRGGLARGSSKVTGTVNGVGSTSSSRDGTNHAYYGAGLTFDLPANVKLEATYDRTRVASRFGTEKSTDDVGVFSLGASIGF